MFCEKPLECADQVSGLAWRRAPVAPVPLPRPGDAGSRRGNAWPPPQPRFARRVATVPW